MDDFTPQPNQAPIIGEGTTTPYKKNILLIAGIAVLIILIGVLSYVLIFRKATTTTAPGATFPIGGNLLTTEQPITNTAGETGAPATTGTGTPLFQKLTEIYKGPVAGYILLNDGRTIRLFDRTLGRLVQVNVNNGDTRTMSDQPILGIHDATFLSNDKVILRGLDDQGNIKSTLYTITETTNDNAPLILDAGTALADNVLEITKNQDGSKALLVIKDPLGANIDQLDTTTQTLTRKGTLPLAEWLPTMTNDDGIYLSAKASRYAMSGTYKLVNKKLIMSIPAGIGQTSSIAPSGSIAYNTGSYGGTFSAELRDPNILAQTEPTNISFITIAEKCAWSSGSDVLYCGVPNLKGNSFPDDWYLGVSHFSDTLQSYNFNSGKEEFLLNPSLYKADLDIVNIMPSTNALFMKNKTDEHLWMYRLSAPTPSNGSGQGTGTTSAQENL